MTKSDRFESARLPLLAALATNTARPRAMVGVLMVLSILGALIGAASTERTRFILAVTVQALVAVLGLVAGPLLAAQQVFSDRQSGALDQHRLARREPTEVLMAYALGPSWVVLALMATTVALTTTVAKTHQLDAVLGYGALSMLGVAAWSVGGVSLALALDRTLPVNQSGGMAVLAAVLRLPVWGVMLGADRMHAVIGLAAFELFMLALATRHALRRIARDEDHLDRSLGPAAAVLSAAVVSVLMGSARWHGSGYSRGFSVFVALTLTMIAGAAVAPTTGAVFRAWIEDERHTAGRLRFNVALAAAVAGASVLASRVAAGASVDAQTALGALFAAALVAVFGALRAAGDAGASRRTTAALAVGAILVPAGSWVASQLGPFGEGSTTGALVSLVGLPLAPAESALGVTLRAVACVGVIAASGVALQRALRRGRALALAKVR